MYEFNGSVAIVTYSGIGAGIADALAGKGSRVVIASRKFDRLQEHAKGVNERLKRVSLYPFAVDLTDTNGPQNLIEYATKELGGLDIVVNAAGLHPSDSDGSEKIGAAYKLNVDAKRRLNRLAVQYMMGQRRGRIINVSSNAATRVFPNQRVYCEQMKQIADDTGEINLIYSQYGIVAHSIGPGLVNTPLAVNDFRDLAVEKVGGGLSGEELERKLQEFWRGPNVLQPCEIGEWIIDILENPEKHPVFETKVKAIL